MPLLRLDADHPPLLDPQANTAANATECAYARYHLHAVAPEKTLVFSGYAAFLPRLLTLIKKQPMATETLIHLPLSIRDWRPRQA